MRAAKEFFIMQDVQIDQTKIETSDEIALSILHENAFYGTIQIVPVTLPKTIPNSTDYIRVKRVVYRDWIQK